jgi:Multiubiquitin
MKELKEDGLQGKHDDKDKDITIIVNGRQKAVTARELSFDQVVALAFDNPPTGQNTIFTVTYRKGEGNKPEGTMVEGEVVKIKDGMIFNVTATNRS